MIEGLEVRWPSGHVDRYQEMPVDTAYVLKEGQARSTPAWLAAAHYDT